MVDHAELAAYAVAHTTPPGPLLEELTAITQQQTVRPGMQTGGAETALLMTLTRVMQPQFVVEVGTFTGASALTIAQELPSGGRILCCDISEEWTGIARHIWERAGVADRIELRIGPAAETLARLPDDLRIDLAFIDADKTGYTQYYDEIITRLAPHGLIVVDDVLWDGAVIDPEVSDETTAAIRSFNDHVLSDGRSHVVLLPTGDGMSLITRSR